MTDTILTEQEQQERKACAMTILQQLGGRVFTVFTGASNLVCGDNWLQFCLPADSAKNGINKVRITLDADDTYTVAFLACDYANHTFRTVEEHDGIYCDMLQEIFERSTGLYTHL